MPPGLIADSLFFSPNPVKLVRHKPAPFSISQHHFRVRSQVRQDGGLTKHSKATSYSRDVGIAVSGEMSQSCSLNKLKWVPAFHVSVAMA